MSESLIPSFLVSNVSELLRLLTKNEQYERFTQVAHQKWVTMRDSLTSLRGNILSWANRSGRSPKWAKEWITRFFEQIAHSLIFGQKRANRTENRWANSQPCLKGLKGESIVCFQGHSCAPHKDDSAVQLRSSMEEEYARVSARCARYSTYCNPYCTVLTVCTVHCVQHCHVRCTRIWIVPFSVDTLLWPTDYWTYSIEQYIA